MPAPIKIALTMTDAAALNLHRRVLSLESLAPSPETPWPAPADADAVTLSDPTLVSLMEHLTAGKHIILTSPLGLSLDDAAREAKARGLTVSLAHALFGFPALHRLADMARRGAIGRLLHVRIDLRAQTLDALALGELLLGWACNLRPREVVAAATLASRSAHALLRCEDHAQAIVCATPHAAGTSITVNGDRGSLSWSESAPHAVFHHDPAAGSIQLPLDAGLDHGPSAALGHVYRAIAESIRAPRERRARKVSGHEPPSVQDLARAAAFAEAAAQSAASSQWVVL